MVLLLGQGVWSAARAEPPTLRVATEGAYPPFNYRDETGNLAGFDVDYAKALCVVMKVRCELVAEPWGTIIDGLVERRYDVIVASMSVTQERKRRVAFTDKYYSTPMRFVARKADSDRLATLTDRTIGAQAETTAIAYLTQGFPFGHDLRPYATMEEAYAALLAGEVEAVLTDSLVAWDFLKSPAGQPFSFVGEPIYTDTEVAIAVRKDAEKLRRRLNRAIALTIIDGTYRRINQKYFPFSIY